MLPFLRIEDFHDLRGMGLLEKLDNYIYELKRAFRNRVEQLSIALAFIFPGDGW